jgi:antitoxin (DNA-binding transcriptional repressor) of toxin-antitoxin stability system
MLNSLKLYIYSVQLEKQSTAMKNVSISEFRANLLKYLTLVQQGGHINVTSKGQVLASLTPPVSQQEAARTKLGLLAETALIHDVVSPIGENWNAAK